MARGTTTAEAAAAFQTFANLCRAHAQEPDLWDDRFRANARARAHSRFRALFEAKA